MTIVFDARWIFPTPSGIGTYARELLACMPVMEADWKFRIIFSSREMARRTLEDINIADRSNVEAVFMPYGIFSPMSQTHLPFALRSWDCDVFHSPNYMLPYLAFPKRRRGRISCVATIHDAIPLLFPDHAPRARKTKLYPLFVKCLRETVLRSDRVLTVSEASCSDLVKSLRLRDTDADKIQVVYNGVSDVFHSENRKPIARDESTPRTLLYVGRLDPYKEVPLLVEAYARVRREVSFPLTLSIAGPPDERYPEALQKAKELQVEDGVSFTGFLSVKELVEAYRNADILVHPSRYEGFGLQLLEAMRSGLPVICTDGGAQPEVAEDAAVVVPSGDKDAFAIALGDLLASPQKQEQLVERGLRRAAQFTWQTTARQVLDSYREARS